MTQPLNHSRPGCYIQACISSTDDRPYVYGNFTPVYTLQPYSNNSKTLICSGSSDFSPILRKIKPLPRENNGETIMTGQRGGGVLNGIDSRRSYHHLPYFPGLLRLAVAHHDPRRWHAGGNVECHPVGLSAYVMMPFSWWPTGTTPWCPWCHQSEAGVVHLVSRGSCCNFANRRCDYGVSG